MQNVPLSVAFFAGVASFLSPCILPLVPGFLVYLAGTSLAQIETRRWFLFLNAVFFVLGFSLVFAALGIALQTVLVHIASDVRLWLSRAGGMLIIVFGLYLARIVKISFFDRAHIPVVHSNPHRSRYVTSFLFGAAFAVGWTPCVGAVLGTILTIAVTQPSAAVALMLAYAFGLGLPFLLVSLFLVGAQKFIYTYARSMERVSVVFGILLVILGVLVFTQRLSLVTRFDVLNRFFIVQ